MSGSKLADLKTSGDGRGQDGQTAVAPGITTDELQLAARNHGMPLEGLRYAITPIGLHFLLIHFDIPFVDPVSWKLRIGGRVSRPLELTLEEVRGYPSVTMAVTLECAGNGRARLSPRPLSQPWLNEAVGTAEWTGTPLRLILQATQPLDDAREVVFTGLDRGIQDDVEHWYERSLPLGEALREEVILAYAINGQSLPPQHGFPLRLVVPGWYGMAHVKWLGSITLLTDKFRGLQQALKYHVKQSTEDPGTPVTRILPRALMIPPGIPDFMSRTRFLPTGRHVLQGRAWSGWAPITRVEVSVDGGSTWTDAAVDGPLSRFAWSGWTLPWEVTRPGRYELCCRATDAAENVQPVTQIWNLEGMANNMAQRVPVVVR